MAGLLLCSVAVAQAQPANDDIANATPITTLPFTDGPVDTTLATTEATDPDCAGSNHTVWYVFTATADFRLFVSAGNESYDNTLSVYTGSPGNLTQLACADDPRVVFDVTAGTTYYFMVGTWYGDYGGTFTFHAEVAVPPSNDDFDSATVIPEPLPFSDAINTLGATTALDDPDCYGRGPTVWYVFTPSEATRVLAETFNSDYSTSLSVYTGTRDSLTQIACTDGGRVVFDAGAGETYYFMVGAAYDGLGGNLVFSVSIAPPRLEVALHIEKTGAVDRVGDAEVRGTLTCSRPAYFSLSGELLQRAGRFVRIEGGFYTEFGCDGVTPWAVTIRGNGPYNPGPAEASATASGTDPETGEGVGDSASATVKLNKAPH
jgi:hypothetical protein